jgi:transcriptional regulator with XRE-family HTH domain
MEMDRAELADFLRRRREALRPEDVGFATGPRRRTSGLRREEVALLAHMSTDYYTRLEQQRGPQPSESMLGAIARGLRLSQEERDHLFRLAGHTPPSRAHRSAHVSPALMRVLDRLDTPAQVVSDLGETLVQNRLAVALVGDNAGRTGHDRFVVHRWFADPAEAARFPEEDRERQGRFHVAALRAALARGGGEDGGARAAIEDLRGRSPAFAALWDEHEIVVRPDERKRILHPVVGAIDLHCERLVAENEAQVLLVYTATPGTEDAERLRLLAVVGDQRFDAAEAG